MGRRLVMPSTPMPPLLPQVNSKRALPGIIAGVIVLVLILAGWLDTGSFSSAGITNRTLSVYEVWRQAEALDGQVIRVQGKANFMIIMTAMLCCPPRCDCNQTEGWLWLVSDNPTVVNIDCAWIDFIEIDTPDCQGDECSLTCTPFNPDKIEAFEFSGQLSVFYLRGHPCSLKLIHVDLPASKQMVNGNWEPIPTGTFTIPLVQPTQAPSLCEEWGKSP